MVVPGGKFYFSGMKGINWKDHIINLFVVILGISVAFYLEGYRETQSAKKLSAKYMISLGEDLKEDRNLLDTLNKINDRLLSNLNKISNASVGAPINEDSLSIYLYSIMYNPPFTPQSTSYESMKTSGQMDLLADFEVRKKVIELYEQYYNGMNQFDDAIAEHLRDFVKPYFVENARYTGPNTLDPAILNNPQFRNMIFSYRSLFAQKSIFYENVLTQVDSTLSILK